MQNITQKRCLWLVPQQKYYGAGGGSCDDSNSRFSYNSSSWLFHLLILSGFLLHKCFDAGCDKVKDEGELGESIKISVPKRDIYNDIEGGKFSTVKKDNGSESKNKLKQKQGLENKKTNEPYQKGNRDPHNDKFHYHMSKAATSEAIENAVNQGRIILQKKLVLSGAPGISVAVSVNGTLVWAEGNYSVFKLSNLSGWKYTLLTD